MSIWDSTPCLLCLLFTIKRVFAFNALILDPENLYSLYITQSVVFSYSNKMYWNRLAILTVRLLMAVQKVPSGLFFMFSVVPNSRVISSLSLSFFTSKLSLSHQSHPHHSIKHILLRLPIKSKSRVWLVIFISFTLLEVGGCACTHTPQIHGKK